MSSPSTSIPSVPDTTDSSPATVQTSKATRRRAVGLIVWAAVTLGFLLYIALGSIQARMWTLNTFQQAWNQEIAPRRIWHIWSFQLQHLPQLGSELFMKVLFGGALAIIVVGCIYVVWLMLDEVRRGDATTSDPAPNGAEQA